MKKTTVIASALATLGLASGIAYASLTGTLGLPEIVVIRDSYSQYEGKIDLREASGAVTYYFWGGDRCAGMVGPTNRKVDMLLDAKMAGHQIQLDYNEHASQYGTSRCWDGGIILW